MIYTYSTSRRSIPCGSVRLASTVLKIKRKIILTCISVFTGRSCTVSPTTLNSTGIRDHDMIMIILANDMIAYPCRSTHIRANRLSGASEPRVQTQKRACMLRTSTYSTGAESDRRDIWGDKLLITYFSAVSKHAVLVCIIKKQRVQDDWEWHAVLLAAVVRVFRKKAEVLSRSGFCCLLACCNIVICTCLSVAV